MTKAPSVEQACTLVGTANLLACIDTQRHFAEEIRANLGAPLQLGALFAVPTLSSQ